MILNISNHYFLKIVYLLILLSNGSYGELTKTDMFVLNLAEKIAQEVVLTKEEIDQAYKVTAAYIFDLVDNRLDPSKGTTHYFPGFVGRMEFGTWAWTQSLQNLDKWDIIDLPPPHRASVKRRVHKKKKGKRMPPQPPVNPDFAKFTDQELQNPYASMVHENVSEPSSLRRPTSSNWRTSSTSASDLGTVYQNQAVIDKVRPFGRPVKDTSSFTFDDNRNKPLPPGPLGGDNLYPSLNQSAVNGGYRRAPSDKK